MAFWSAALLALQVQTPKVTLTYFQEHFIVRDGAFNESAPLKLPEPATKLSTVFRRNATFAVWDERGLTIRVGSRVKSSKLPDIATSPKAFARDEILETLSEIRKGRRTREASGLSGAIRVGNRAFFLARWEDHSGKPWAESLVQVELSQTFPEPKMLGRPAAMSLGSLPIDDKLFILEGKITYVASKKDHWGIEQFDPHSGRFTFEELGGTLLSYIAAEGTKTSGLFVERTFYGTTVAGRIDLATRNRKAFSESRAKMRFVDGAEPSCIIQSSGSRASLLNASTGAQFGTSDAWAVRRTSRGLIIWTPVDNPKRAWLYDPARWQVLTWWNAAQSRDEP